MIRIKRSASLKKRYGDADMAETNTDIPATGSRIEQTFPTLSQSQLDRIAEHGTLRVTRQGDILIDLGEVAAPFFVVLTGELETVRPSDDSSETLVSRSVPGQFTGEVNTLSGRPALFQTRVVRAGKVIELDRHNMLTLVQDDAELSEIVMRAFLFRRAELVAAGVGDVILIGSTHSAATLRIKDFLMRNGHPYSYIDLECDPDVEKLLTGFRVGVDEIPVVICRGNVVLRNPTVQQIADCLGFNESIEETALRDLIVVGAGPAGLAAAVYGASEGLSVLIIESNAPGGQAGSSSRIENYLGFPTGISGRELAASANSQAEKFGAEILIAKSTRFVCDRKPYSVELESGARSSGRAVVIATGVQYRRLSLDNVTRFEGAGIYYGATFVEAQLCANEEVIVVGGANSAGQAAAFLGQTAKRVYVLIRSANLSESMSRYLIRRIDETPTIFLKPHTEIVALEGGDHLESVRWRNSQTAALEEQPIRHVFVMTGATPNTSWLGDSVLLDAKGYIKTGTDLSSDDLKAARWQLGRQPYFLESSLPGVFAVGDVRASSIKRVASAVGEGSTSLSFIHEALQE
jgi:thioredoxin reductase (NADPH)